MRRERMIAAVAAALFLSLSVLALGRSQEDGKAPLPEAERNQLIAHDIKIVQDVLAKGTLDTKSSRKLQATALMLAAYAQGALDTAKAKEMATLRDTALKLLQAAEGKNAAEAKKQAETLKLDMPADPAAQTTPVPLPKLLPLELLMRQFSSERVGGFAIEKELEEVADGKDALTPEQIAKLLPL